MQELQWQMLLLFCCPLLSMLLSHFSWTYKWLMLFWKKCSPLLHAGLWGNRKISSRRKRREGCIWEKEKDEEGLVSHCKDPFHCIAHPISERKDRPCPVSQRCGPTTAFSCGCRILLFLLAVCEELLPLPLGLPSMMDTGDYLTSLADNTSGDRICGGLGHLQCGDLVH